MNYTWNKTWAYGWCLLLISCLSGCSIIGIDPFENPAPREPKAVPDHYENYNSIPASKKTVSLSEPFSDNSRNWPLYSSSWDYLISISGGALRMNNRASSTQQCVISLPALTGAEDFEIEAYLKLEDASYSYGNAGMVIWGLSNTTPDQRQYARISIYSGDYTFDYYNGTTYHSTDISGNSWKGSFNRSGFNTLTVRRVKNNCYYFLNGTLLTKNPAVGFYGNRIGFQVSSYTNMTVDYLTVSKLTLN